MILQIHDNLSISEVQERFSQCFPSLKIEFYCKRHRIREESPDSFLISPEKKLGEIRRIHNAGCMELKSWYRVADVERDFKEQFDLNVQVFRNENGEWVQTSNTDKYSLAQQSEMSSYAHNCISPKFKEQLGEYNYL